jgi:hypothetical protein
MKTTVKPENRSWPRENAQDRIAHFARRWRGFFGRGLNREIRGPREHRTTGPLPFRVFGVFRGYSGLCSGWDWLRGREAE